MEIVTVARGWLGTKFIHQGRVKNVGCDCIGLIMGVIDELQILDKSGKLLSDYDEKTYGRVPDGFMLQQKLDKHLTKIHPNQMQIGDIVLIKFGKNPQHLAIITDYGDDLGLIHCYCASKKVVEHRLDKMWKNRIVAAYRF